MPPRPRSDRRPNRTDAPRRDETPAGGGGSSSAAADDIKRFAELMRSQEAKAKKDAAAQREKQAAEKARVEAEQAAANQLATAQQAKERAAQRLKDVRARGASNAVVAEAETAYKAALADLVAVESGERPSWAPPLREPEPEPAAEGDGAEASADDGAPADDGPATD